MDQWLGMAQLVVGAGLTTLLFIAGHVLANIKASGERRFADVERRFGEFEKRMDKAGQKQSDLTDKLHMLPERETVNRIWEEVAQMRLAVAALETLAAKHVTLHADQIAELRLRVRAVEERRDGGERRNGEDRRGNGADV